MAGNKNIGIKDELTPELREKLSALIVEKNFTVDEILSFLDSIRDESKLREKLNELMVKRKFTVDEIVSFLDLMGRDISRRCTHSRIEDELTPELRQSLNALIVEQNFTVDEIKAFLESMGHNIGRGSCGRYKQKFQKQMREATLFQEQSAVLLSKAGEGLVLEEAASKLFTTQIIKGLLDGTIDVTTMPRMISDFAKLQTSSVVRERIKKEFAEKAEKTADQVENIVKKGGLSDKAAASVRKKILGMAK